MSEDLRELYQEIILDHGKRPRNFGPLAGATHSAEGFNPLCGDKVRVHLKLGGNGLIEDIHFEGKGCAISQASASIMTELVKGRPLEEAEALMQAFLHLVKGEDGGPAMDETDRETLEVMAGVRAFPMRVKCATLGWHTMKAAAEGAQAPVATE